MPHQDGSFFDWICPTGLAYPKELDHVHTSFSQFQTSNQTALAVEFFSQLALRQSRFFRKATSALRTHSLWREWIVLHGLLTTLGHMGMPADPGPNLMWLLVLAPYLVMVLGLLLGTWFSYLKSEVTLTDRRLVFRTGFLSRRSGELPLENVESIYISEPLLGRICGYGTVMVTTFGGAGFPLAFIGSPQNFHSTVQNAVLDVKNSIRDKPKPPESGLPPQDVDSRYLPRG